MTSNPILEAALQYAGRGWRVIPLYGLAHGACTCKDGTRCLSPGKHPAVKAGKGFERASTDRGQIEKWFRRGGRNLGIATGRGLAVVDIDGAAGLDTLRGVCGSLPRTLMASSGRGVHLYFTADQQIPTNSGDGLDIRGDGGMVVAPPSDHYSGKRYTWTQAPIAQLPAELLTFFCSRRGTRTNQAQTTPIDKVPAYLLNLPSASDRLADRATADMDVGPIPLTDLSAVARTIPNDDRGWDDWNRIGMAFYASSDGSDDGLEAFCQWSEKSKKYDEDTCLSRWEHYDKSPPDSIGFGTLVYEAKQADPGFVLPSNVIAPNPAPSNYTNGTTVALPAAFLANAIVFPDVNRLNKPLPTCRNAVKAIEALGISCSMDVFHDQMLVGGQEVREVVGDLSDNCVAMLRAVIERRYDFDPGERNARDAAIRLCLAHKFDPVCDYLAGLSWDTRPRINQWVIDYLGAPDTELHRTFGRLMLVAAVRRARAPGTKFDQIIILEGPQGIGKSSAVRILAGEANYSDQHILGVSDREQQEAFQGVWLHEIAELAGMRRADVERVKHFARRTEDRARPAYGRHREDKPRRGIFIATTNEHSYLREYDRAFWPITTAQIDLAKLRADRDQLWAEAAAVEASGESLALPERLYGVAAEEQELRHEIDSWEDFVLQSIRHQSDTSIFEILTGNVFHMSANEISQANQNRVSRILRKLGFIRYQVRSGTNRLWRYKKLVTGD